LTKICIFLKNIGKVNKIYILDGVKFLSNLTKKRAIGVLYGDQKRSAFKEKEGSLSIAVYLDKRVWDDFQKFIASSGISVSRMIEAIMRVACNPKVTITWERIYYAILKTIKKSELRGQTFILELLENMGKALKSSIPIDYLDGIQNRNFPGETFRVLKEKEECGYGKYCTRRLERIGKHPLIGCD